MLDRGNKIEHLRKALNLAWLRFFVHFPSVTLLMYWRWRSWISNMSCDPVLSFVNSIVAHSFKHLDLHFTNPKLHIACVTVYQWQRDDLVLSLLTLYCIFNLNKAILRNNIQTYTLFMEFDIVFSYSSSWVRTLVLTTRLRWETEFGEIHTRKLLERFWENTYQSQT